MKRASPALCAVGGVLLGLAGCAGFDLAAGLQTAEAAAGVRVVDGKPEAVAVTLQETLKRRGLEVTVVNSGDTVVLESATTAGLKFGLVLRSQRAADGREQTRVALEWLDNRKDQQTSAAIFAEIDRQGGAKK